MGKMGRVLALHLVSTNALYDTWQIIPLYQAEVSCPRHQQLLRASLNGRTVATSIGDK
jgi:hypothetical protein